MHSWACCACPASGLGCESEAVKWDFLCAPISEGARCTADYNVVIQLHSLFIPT